MIVTLKYHRAGDWPRRILFDAIAVSQGVGMREWRPRVAIYAGADADLTGLLKQLTAAGVPTTASGNASQPNGFVQVELNYAASTTVGRITDDLSELWRTATMPRPTILTDSEDLRFLLFKRNVPTELPT